MNTTKAEWSWEARERQLNEHSKKGDVVNVGYLADNDPHNYEDATIIDIRKVKYYPNGNLDSETTRLVTSVKFANGDVINW